MTKNYHYCSVCQNTVEFGHNCPMTYHHTMTVIEFINKLATDARETGAVTIEDMTYLTDEFPSGFWRKLAKEVNYLQSNLGNR